MKYLLYILILIFASVSVAFADGEHPEDVDVVEFKIDEKLFQESMGNDGYYKGGFYAEEKNGLGAIYYSSTTSRRDFGFVPGLVILNRQVVPLNFLSPVFRSFGLGTGFLSGSLGFSFGGLHFHHR